MINNTERLEGLVSVVVPIFNQEQYLPRCLASLIRQTYTNLEIILVDDGSTDESGLICDQFAIEDPRCKVIHKKNGGLWSARNAGHNIAKGDWLIFIDSDDYCNIDMIRLMLRAASADSGIDLVMVDAAMTTSQEENISPFMDSDIPSGAILSQTDLMEGLTSRHNLLFAVVWNKLYRRELIESIRHRNLDRDEDFDFNLHVFSKTQKCIYLDKTLYWWFQHQKSMTHTVNSLSLHYNCRFRVLTEFLQNLREEERRFEGLILRRLFRDFALFSGWQYRRNLGATDLETRSFINDARKRYTGHYLKRKDIGSFEKLCCLFMLTCPFFAWEFMKLTKNI